MSAVHIDLIIGNRDSLRNEDKSEAVGGRQPLPHKAENHSVDVLEIPVDLPEKLAESIAESVKKIKAGECTQR